LIFPPSSLALHSVLFLLKIIVVIALHHLYLKITFHDFASSSSGNRDLEIKENPVAVAERMGVGVGVVL